MTIVVNEPGVDGLMGVVDALRAWQDDRTPLQLHPGDLGWAWALGAERLAADVRTWNADGRIIAVGYLDGPDVLRLTTAPDLRQDETLARQLQADLDDPERGVLPAGPAGVEIPNGALLREVLLEAGWNPDEPWTPLRRDLSEPVRDCGLRIEVAGPRTAGTRAAVHRSAFGSPKFTEEVWHVLAAGPVYSDARCLIGYDDQDNAVAAATVWSAGPGKPGLLEPMGVHADHRGRGHGTAISVAAAAALREMGASSALVSTPSSNTAAVATYRAAGYEPSPERLDVGRAA
ncbi:GNAT family N-acetyltransferase [Streptomyces alfalfae]|uniref:Acetyltransferase n=1 Tax=Streptomyces alfalfae TaxID=1642299 RepID=A0ABN4VYW9_9ACTN|nr:GNAT family N-acetyltransferase [Streptomyces alfalfae]AYA20557.1 GNAT family N-acetyltransferase [Streptomyces fradiae]APY91353.1 acetyltransferase [Streptomyces alfalfae]QUI29826.1 GNAT family N-acetyltransferase [Streptomyces alfalfae]RXX34763.1 GNAT family N-acetyltransferase [Streptomyces alfalfae]RZM91540.1 GNAT family N-acetyltransferase [Streptomyces alfalfae]